MIDNPEKREWDVVVIGTGMGGATIGYALAKAGKSVLFCEKGKSHLNNNRALRGDYAENFSSQTAHSTLDPKDIMALAGRWNEEIDDISSSRKRRFVPFIGLGTGGSSALYGMALERFFPSDFTPKQYYPHAHNATLPAEWPISHEELFPHYKSAECLYRVRGTHDPLREDGADHFLPPPSLTPGAEELHGLLLGKGLHPYRLPLGCEFVPGCECCQSYLCDQECKNDSSRICLKPALADFGAHLLAECEVLKLEATRSDVTGILCNWNGRQITLRGRIVVLAAGALESPRILLNSTSPEWQNGLGNDSGLVGRNLMRHYIDLYAIIPKTQGKFPLDFKEIAFNDYYLVGGQKFGTVQSFGAMPPASILAKGLEHELKGAGIPGAGSLFGLVKPAMRLIIGHLFSRRMVLATIMEDLPYRDNRITVSDEVDYFGRRRLILNYRICEHERSRIVAFRNKMSDLLKGYSFMLIKQAENNERIAHACGTCRFGMDPADSVLDRNNKAHGLSNLYVVDASFFPSSGGTNPALTIAANALRVAEHIILSDGK